MPRPYRLGQREAASEQTRARILAAARELLITSDGFAAFSMDAVARRADVARMTVYHQFGSKIGLLEALCDLLAAGGGMETGMGVAFQQPDPWAALERYVAQFGQLWAADRILTRRLRALAALDPDFAQVIRARDEWRRQGLTVLLGRLPGWSDAPVEARATMVNALFTLLSFEFFDTLAGPERELAALAPEVYRLARAALLVERPGASG
jgi:AcrR family transcriptional regulator